jgi:hypothetical protein
LAAGDKAGAHGGHFIALKLAHPLAQVIRLRPRQPGDLTCDAQDLFLEDQHTFGAAEDRLQRRVQVRNGPRRHGSADEVLRHAAQRRSRLEKGVGDGQVLHGARLKLAQRALRAARFALEDADGVPARQHLACGRSSGGMASTRKAGS